ncbi:MAG: hypothetical protein ACFE8L_03380 [Candidatus Hodarchaeota archaeon]
MIKSIYFLDENGFLLYSKNFMEEKYDQNVLIGFFSSIANFSREALGGIVKNIDLGENNKLIFVPNSEERILGASVVSSNDNNQLVTLIVKNMMQDFIDSYSPDYDLESIYPDDVESIINNNLRRKIMPPLRIRLLLSWIIAGFLCYFLILLSINVTSFMYDYFNLNRFFTPEQLFTRFMPILILLSTINIIILFLLPNLILGFLSLNWKIATLNSLIYLVITITLYFYSTEPNFAYIIVGHLPLSLIFSLFFLFIGTRYSSKMFLKR